MAQNRVELDSENFSCSICLDLLKDPVTIPCGHSYCMRCIKGRWDGEDQKRIYSCPQCRRTIKRRPVLEKNVTLTELVEEMKKNTRQAAAAAAGPEDVACDVCTKRKMKALKSCLVCVASFCENHLQPHYEAPPLKKHKLTEPTKKLQENICSRHDKVMEIFCCTDQQLICCFCSVEEHKGHDAVSAEAERAERQRKLEVSRQNIQQRILDRENSVKLLQQEVEAICDSADKAVEEIGKTLKSMIRIIKKLSSGLRDKIKFQQVTKVSRFKELEEKLQQEITELKRKDDELKQFLETEDHNQFLHNFPSVSALGESTHSSSINVGPQIRFKEVTAKVSKLRDKLRDTVREKWATNPQRYTVRVVLPPEPEPETRAGFLRYSHDITLDPNTANKHLMLSDGDRKVKLMKQQQSYPDHPDRFTGRFQVLSRESLTGRCYWEVELGGLGVHVAVSYKNNKGAASQSPFGSTDKSWAFYCSRDSYVFLYKNTKTPLPGPLSNRIGVYLDHSAGILSFYSISKTMNLLHRVQTTFIQPLHAGFKLVYYGSSAEFIKLSTQSTSKDRWLN